ncbi:hypothetical protein ABEX38_21940 [Priestia megaterium]
MRFGSGGFLLLASLFLAGRGLYRLFKTRKFGLLIFHFFVLVTFPFIFMKILRLILNVENEDLRLIFGIPIFLLLPIYLTWGFFVNDAAKKADTRKNVM